MWIVITLCEDTWEISPDREVAHKPMSQFQPALKPGAESFSSPLPSAVRTLRLVHYRR